MKADGFDGVVLEFAFKDVRFDPWAPDWDAASRITDALQRHDLKVAALYGYYNVIHPDVAQRRRGEERMLFLIENWRRLGSPHICTETGTFNSQSEWIESPKNDTEEGFVECREALSRLAKAAEKTGAVVAIEAYWRNVISSAARTERLFREVKSRSLKLVMDPCNYFRKEDLPRMDSMLQEIFKRVGKQTVLAHAKDVKAAASGTDLPAAGLGVLNYPLYLHLLSELNKDLFLAIEHLSLEGVPRARAFVLSQFERI